MDWEIRYNVFDNTEATMLHWKNIDNRAFLDDLETACTIFDAKLGMSYLAAWRNATIRFVIMDYHSLLIERIILKKTVTPYFQIKAGKYEIFPTNKKPKLKLPKRKTRKSYEDELDELEYR